MKKMSKGMLMTALICGAVYLGNTPVYASELQEFALDEYVVTAARTETKLVDTPANISVVDAQTIEERHYQDVSEVLKDVPGATVVDNGVGASEKVLRLNGDDRVLVLVDGRRVTNDAGSTSSGRNGMDINLVPDVGLIERIEILKGAGGALYGSEAVGGVVNIITKKADRNYGKVSLGFGSNDRRDMRAMYSVKEGKTSLSVSASKDKQGYYKYRDVVSDTTKRWGASSKYNNEKTSLKFNQEISNDSNLSLGYDHSKYEGVNTYNFTGLFASKLDKTSDNIYVKYDWAVNENDNGFIQYYHNELEYNNLASGQEGFYDEKTNGIDAQQEINLSKLNKLVVGTSWRKTDVDVAGYCNYGESIDNIAFFMNDTWEFLPSWTLNTGIRYDNHSEAGNETTMSAALNKRLSDSSHMYVNWGQVFRAPTTDDLFYYSPAGTDEYGGWFGPSLGNKDLKAETGETWTIGYQTLINSRTDMTINYFESDLDDAIAWEYGEYCTYEPSYVRNIDKQKKKGMELNIKHNVNDNLDIEASYTYLSVKNNENNKGFEKDNNAIPNMYRAGIRYHDNKWNADIFLRAGSGASNVKYVESSYITVDCAITYKATKDLSFFARGYNLFNEAYAEQGGITGGKYYSNPAQSRRFIVGAEYKF